MDFDVNAKASPQLCSTKQCKSSKPWLIDPVCHDVGLFLKLPLQTRRKWTDECIGLGYSETDSLL